MRKFFRQATKAVSFLLIFAVLFSLVTYATMERGWDQVNGILAFFDEAENSLDAVYIGSSVTYSSWVAPVAWKKYGVAMRVLTNNSQAFIGVESFLKAARKSQPNAVYLIAINGYYKTAAPIFEDLHHMVDHFPFSIEKFRLTAQLCRDFQCTPAECLELFFPLVRYHTRWSDLQAGAFHTLALPYKGVADYRDFLEGSKDISSLKPSPQECGDIPDFTENALVHLLEYCKKESIKVVFVLSAQYGRDVNEFKAFRTIEEKIRSYGFPMINELEDFDKIGLDDTKDFYNANHTNIHGALKVTDYLAQYLLDHYDFPEKSSGGGTKVGILPMKNTRRSLRRI